jgi:hypothetical protein
MECACYDEPNGNQSKPPNKFYLLYSMATLIKFRKVLSKTKTCGQTEQHKFPFFIPFCYPYDPEARIHKPSQCERLIQQK